MGTILEVFHRRGKVPVFIEKLKSSVTEGVMLQATNFSSLAGIRSGPVDLLGSNVTSRW